MAYTIQDAVTQDTIFRGGLADRLVCHVTTLKDVIVSAYNYRKTVRELSKLSDATLADLGLNRSMIASTAYEATYAAK